jgi:hypothetical protein
MNPDDLQKEVRWLRHEDIMALLASSDVPAPWFPAYRHTETSNSHITWFSAIVPVTLVPNRMERPSEWDLRIGEGGPVIGTSYQDGKPKQFYRPGNEDGIQPLVIHRSFHGLREGFHELMQEFRLYFNLFPEPSKKRFIIIDDDGDESEAVRYGDDFMEIRTDLVFKFCVIKQAALAIYVDSFRHSKKTLEALGLVDTRTTNSGAQCGHFLAIIAEDPVFKTEFETAGSVVGKKYIMPEQMPEDTSERSRVYQSFIIGVDASAKPIFHSCDPEKLSNYFGKNAGAPHYLTPVYFRPEVLAKYYTDPGKYSVEDGYLRCAGMWGLRVDNDHTDCVMVFLGDLGRDLSEKERNYWLSFNIEPGGRKMSQTTYRRGFLAEWTDPQKPDLVFKQEYDHFNRIFREANKWDFFLPLHEDDMHFLTTLRLLTKDNQAEFDSQLLALTKLLVDSLNEKGISMGLKTLAANDKGISKLEKFFKERSMIGFEPHVKFLRVLQELRSKSAAHRKGSSYDMLIADLEMADEGQQRVFSALLMQGSDLIKYLSATLTPKGSD